MAPERAGTDTGVRDFQLVPEGEWGDPHPSYHRMRAETPVLAAPQIDSWVLTRHADCERVLRDPAFSSNPSWRRAPIDPAGLDLRSRLQQDTIPVLLFLDPPDHTRLRRLVSHAFTPRRVEQLRVHVADLVNRCIDEIAGEIASEREVDLIASLGYPLPVTVIAELLGVPVEDRHLFGPWSSDVSRLLDGDIDEATANAGVFAVMQLINYLNPLFDERRAEPRDDLISALLAVEEEGDRLTEQELRAIVLLLFIAGHETTTNLIGNGVVAMMRNRSEWDRLVADPALGGGRG